MQKFGTTCKTYQIVEFKNIYRLI